MTASRCLRVLLAAAVLAAVASCGGGGAANEVRIPLGAGGVGFLPLLVMREHGLIEKHASAAGIQGAAVRWIQIGGPAVVNDALLAGNVDFIAAGPPAFITLWDRTLGSVHVMGAAAITSLPMYLNTTAEHLRSIDDLTEQDKIAVTAPNVSIPAIVMQMYARERYGPDQVFRFDRYTIARSHPDGAIALLSGSGDITAHFTSPPFHQREVADARVRTIMTTNDVLGGSTTFTMLSTTARFRDSNPELYRAVLAALEEANEMIRTDSRMAAELLLETEGGGFSVDELVAMLEDPAIKFTTTPENVLRYAHFMHDIGSIANRPESWRDLFFPELHDAPGS